MTEYAYQISGKVDSSAKIENYHKRISIKYKNKMQQISNSPKRARSTDHGVVRVAVLRRVLVHVHRGPVGVVEDVIRDVDPPRPEHLAGTNTETCAEKLHRKV